MLKYNLQLFGGRGASSGGAGTGAGGGGTFRSASDFEKAIGDNYNDPRVQEYTDAYREESDYNRGLERNLGRSIDEDGYTKSTDNLLNSEKKDTEKALKELPDRKTPTQLGKEEALKERLDVIKNLQKRKGEKGSGRGNVDIVS